MAKKKAGLGDPFRVGATASQGHPRTPSHLYGSTTVLATASMVPRPYYPDRSLTQGLLGSGGTIHPQVLALAFARGACPKGENMSPIKRTSPQGGCSPLIPGAPVTYRRGDPRLFVKTVAVWLADDGVVIKRFLGETEDGLLYLGNDNPAHPPFLAPPAPASWAWW